MKHLECVLTHLWLFNVIRWWFDSAWRELEANEAVHWETEVCAGLGFSGNSSIFKRESGSFKSSTDGLLVFSGRPYGTDMVYRHLKQTLRQSTFMLQLNFFSSIVTADWSLRKRSFVASQIRLRQQSQINSLGFLMKESNNNSNHQ